MTKPIRGKVAQVLNEREVAINIGAAHGVTIGMYFNVIDPHYENIKDPDTGEVLGSFKRPKVGVQVIQVEEKISLASTYREVEVNIGGSGGPGNLRTLYSLDAILGPFSRSLMPPKWVMKYETLRKTGKTVNELNEEDSYVNIGDPVVQVTDLREIKQEDAQKAIEQESAQETQE